MQSHTHEALAAFEAFCNTIKALRTPVTGCPWDLKQTHVTLAKNMIEEAYEASTVMEENNLAAIKEELGDVLLQVVLNAQIATDDNHFTLADVITGINEKIIRRHPHVFGSAEDLKKRELGQILERWEDIKAQEKGISEDIPFLEQKGVHKVFPATTQCGKIGKACQEVGFEWENISDVVEDLKSEVKEFEDEFLSEAPERMELMKKEMGDVYFVLGQLCRRLGWEPELVAMNGNHKFIKRFNAMEKLIKAANKTLKNCSLDEMDHFWQMAKQHEREAK